MSPMLHMWRKFSRFTYGCKLTDDGQLFLPTHYLIHIKINHMFLHFSLCVCVYTFMSALLNLDSRCAKKFQFHFDGHSLYIFIYNNPYTVRAPRKDWKNIFLSHLHMIWWTHGPRRTLCLLNAPHVFFTFPVTICCQTSNKAQNCHKNITNASQAHVFVWQRMVNEWHNNEML